MLRVALTGGIATGKTFVLKYFSIKGIPTIDADKISKKIVRPKSPAWNLIRLEFGNSFFTSRGELNRKLLAEKIFADKKARIKLESIIHPYVKIKISEWFKQLERELTATIGIADIPLLFETKSSKDFDKIIVTTCKPETQLKRLMERDNLSDEEARNRLKAQLPSASKASRADFVIKTNKDFKTTERQVETILEKLKQLPN